MNQRAENPLEGEPEQPQVRDEDVIWSSQSAHWHCTPEGIRLLTADEEAEEKVQSLIEEGAIEPDPLQVTVRNRQGEPIRTISQWDGYQLHLDVAHTREQKMPLREAVQAAWRYYVDRWGGWLLPILLVITLALSALGVWFLFSPLL